MELNIPKLPIHEWNHPDLGRIAIRPLTVSALDQIQNQFDTTEMLKEANALHIAREAIFIVARRVEPGTTLNNENYEVAPNIESRDLDKLNDAEIASIARLIVTTEDHQSALSDTEVFEQLKRQVIESMESIENAMETLRRSTARFDDIMSKAKGMSGWQNTPGNIDLPLLDTLDLPPNPQWDILESTRELVRHQAAAIELLTKIQQRQNETVSHMATLVKTSISSIVDARRMYRLSILGLVVALVTLLVAVYKP